MIVFEVLIIIGNLSYGVTAMAWFGEPRNKLAIGASIAVVFNIIAAINIVFKFMPPSSFCCDGKNKDT